VSDRDDLLDGLTNEQLGQLLLTENLKLMVRKIRGGEATAADQNVALMAVKAMGIQMIPKPTNPLGQLTKAITDNLPFAGTDTAH
jgi:hypothetical protein